MLSAFIRGLKVFTTEAGRRVRAPNLLNRQDPWAAVRVLQGWVDTHPAGTPIAVHYDPHHQRNAALVATDMPLGGPRNLELLGITAAACATLLAIAHLARKL